MRTHLQRYHDHEDLLLLVGEDVFNESPAGADQCECDEEESPLEPAKYSNVHQLLKPNM